MNVFEEVSVIIGTADGKLKKCAAIKPADDNYGEKWRYFHQSSGLNKPNEI